MTEPHAGAWVTAVPACDDGMDTVMKPQVFRTAVAYRLGATVVPSEVPCRMCTQTVETLGDHASCCARNGDLIVRHNRVRNLVARFCGEGLLSPVLEQCDILQQSERLPGDITLPNWKKGCPLGH